MSNIRKISRPFALMLALLLMAGSSGYSYVIHTCHHCIDSREINTIGVIGDLACCADDSESHCVTHEEHGAGGYVLRHDCCSHEVEKLLKDDLLRIEVQTELMPFNIVSPAVTISFTEDSSFSNILHLPGVNRAGRLITTLHCQIRA